MASENCKLVLKQLARSRNVLLSGPPGTGKSRLLAEVAQEFKKGAVKAKSAAPQLDAHSAIPIPPPQNQHVPAISDIPAPGKLRREVFRTVFHQNSKNRDFISGITPAVNRAAGEPDFTVVAGTLYRASEHAKQESGTALLIIDEINRGPAVQVFGGAIVAIEQDKRLAEDGTPGPETQFFEMLDPLSNVMVEYALPHDLYILAAMNQADASVEPLDVAFLRRWEPLRLEPDEATLRAYCDLPAKTAGDLPPVPSGVEDVLEASVRAWTEINNQIALGRGPEFCIGHGVLMSTANLPALPVDEVLEVLCIGWAKIRSHIEEVFFGDMRGFAATLNALDGPDFNPFRLAEYTFAGDLRFRLEGPANFSKDNLYPTLRAIAGARE